jgi:hypothetical protein
MYRMLLGLGFSPPLSGLACKAIYRNNTRIVVSICLNLQAGGAVLKLM